MSKEAKVILQIDCDSEIAISNHYGIQMEDREDSLVYYNALDQYLDLLKKYNLRATLFVVGADLNCSRKCFILRKAISQQHEIANHTYQHPVALRRESPAQLQKELEDTDEIIKRKLKVVPRGFRAPNFEADQRTLPILKAMNYEYDCSVLPTPYLPLIQRLKKKDAGDAGYLGNWQYMLAPRAPYYPREDVIWKADRTKHPNLLLELPVSTFPYLGFPCHSSYLLALPELIRNNLLSSMLSLYRRRERPFIYVFHLADLVPDNYLYGTEKKHYGSLEERLRFIEKFLSGVSASFTSYTTLEYVRSFRPLKG